MEIQNGFAASAKSGSGADRNDPRNGRDRRPFRPRHPKEPEWPKADFIGNPPFLGGKLLRTHLGDEYVDAMFEVWDDRVPREADLCCYWFREARRNTARRPKAAAGYWRRKEFAGVRIAKCLKGTRIR